MRRRVERSRCSDEQKRRRSWHSSDRHDMTRQQEACNSHGSIGYECQGGHGRRSDTLHEACSARHGRDELDMDLASFLGSGGDLRGRGHCSTRRMLAQQSAKKEVRAEEREERAR